MLQWHPFILGSGTMKLLRWYPTGDYVRILIKLCSPINEPMKIAVLNGSPKGEVSVTMQYVHFIGKNFPRHELKIINISQRIKVIEEDENSFREIIDDVRSADGILWAFPLYYLLVPSQYKRFIELISEKKAEEVFKGKYTASLSTSIHFFDHTAHDYINAICDDLGMNYLGSFSAEMYDLLREEERDRFSIFARDFFRAIQNNIPTPKNFPPVVQGDFDYLPGAVEEKVDLRGKKVLILTDAGKGEKNLDRMVERLTRTFSPAVEVVNLNDLEIKGGCLGCCQCGYDNRCVYEGRDGYIDFYNNKVKTADILIMAGAIKDRYLSSIWKLFFDRSFFSGHAPSLIGKQIGFIIAGPLRQIPNLRQILEAQVQTQHANCAGFVTDEYEDSGEIDRLLQELAIRMVQFSDDGYVSPPTFLGVGGRKIFRDEIWGKLRFPFRADYRAYKKSGVFDFPQKKYKSRIRNAFLLGFARIPRFRRELDKRMKIEMIKPLQKVIGRT